MLVERTLGVVSLTESEGRDFTNPDERIAAYFRMRERVRQAFGQFIEMLPKSRKNIRLMGTSGTVTTPPVSISGYRATTARR